jgi:coenzyme F420-0:L-glutamate ligase/coenzyme F420-1:gamma-L-glutamate ligase
MPRGNRPVSAAIAARRSVRRFADSPAVDREMVRGLVSLACTAPAPHHSRPWRWAHIVTDAGRERLADAVGDAWRADLEAEGRSVHEVAHLLGRSRAQLMDAPVLIVACLSLQGARPWPDDRRRQAERDMFMQSLGAALQNLLLAAGEHGLTGYLKGAPLFCHDAVRTALDLPGTWEPAFFVQLGYPRAGVVPDPREPPALADILIER